MNGNLQDNKRNHFLQWMCAVSCMTPELKELALSQLRGEFFPYYKQLVNQFALSERYVAFVEDNACTYSVEYAQLLQAICAEIDVFAKAICLLLDKNFDRKANSQKWCIELHEFFPEFESFEVRHSTYGLIKPWHNWDCEWYINSTGSHRTRLKKGKKTPAWWTSYNKVKHERALLTEASSNYYPVANLENVMNAMVALHSLGYLIEGKLSDGIHQIYSALLF
jgi:hypothetical protein